MSEWTYQCQYVSMACDPPRCDCLYHCAYKRYGYIAAYATCRLAEIIMGLPAADIEAKQRSEIAE